MSPILAFYGDDFTGSTDAMEALQWAGLRTVLFLEPPTRERLSQFENLRAFGVAGLSRTMAPEEMDARLRPDLRQLRACGAAIVHYKICSTFDSSPQIGSIGRAMEIGREVFGAKTIPILVGAPVLGRYQAFGNLFARSGLDTEPFRLDRHPTMKRHPITPMDEADLREHLATQTSLSVGLVDLLQLAQPQAAEKIAAELTDSAASAALFDVLYPEHLPTIGEVFQRLSPAGNGNANEPLFVVGSSGVEYALTEHWRASGRIESLRSHSPGRPDFGAVDQLVVITGSCSPVNDRQITWALANGFEEIPLRAARLIDADTSENEITAAVQRAVERLRAGANVILHSSRGPSDARIAETLAAYRRMGFSDLDIKLKSGSMLGPKLGEILRRILQAHPLPRAAVAGGDTSSYAARQLEIEALEAVAPVAPGSPLCRTIADNELNGVELMFKGGQVGKEDFWGRLLKGSDE